MRLIALFFVLCLPHATRAEPLRVVADIAPVHALVAQVMGETGAPDLLLPPDTSPHAASLRPSDARRLSAADVVVWVGPELTPWLEKSLTSLAPDARVVGLLNVPGVRGPGHPRGAVVRGGGP